MSIIKYLFGTACKAMGNKTSYKEMRRSNILTNDGKRTWLQIHSLEEDYLPMSRAMKKTVVDSRKFHHVTPRNVRVCACRIEGMSKQSGNGKDKEDKVNDLLVSNGRNLTVDPDVYMNAMDRSGSLLYSSKNKDMDTEKYTDNFEERLLHEKNVKLFGPKKTEKEKIDFGEKEIYTNKLTGNAKDMYKYLANNVTRNRNYSLTELKEGLRKSKSTLELKRKMRQSKLNGNMNGWKKLSYQMENSHDKKMVGSIHKEKSFFNQEHNVCENPYCAQNCQILGLCAVKGRELNPNYRGFEPFVFKEDLNRKCDVKPLLNSYTKHPKSEDCNCDLCILGYLTDMDFSDECKYKPLTSVDNPRKINEKSVADKNVTGDVQKENIQIIDIDNRFKSIEVSVSRRQPAAECPGEDTDYNTSGSNVSMDTMKEYWTNLKIRKLFEENNKALPLKNRLNYAKTASFKESGVPNNNTPFSSGNKNTSSSSILSASVASSMSTVMSYQRVKEIFQMFIEKNRSRKKCKRNIKKFKEMEELGLGEVKNNKWYPNHYKTLSIWNEMNSSLQGVQAQFKTKCKPCV